MPTERRLRAQTIHAEQQGVKERVGSALRSPRDDEPILLIEAAHVGAKTTGLCNVSGNAHFDIG